MLTAVLLVLTVLGLVGGLAFAGLWLCWSGLVGRMLDQHAHCAECNYDLYGHGLLPRQCPECGTQLYGPDAVRVGCRQMRPERVATGALCLALGVLPLLWLMYDAERAGAASRAQAVANYYPMYPIQPAHRQPTRTQRAGATWHRAAAHHPVQHQAHETSPTPETSKQIGRRSHRSRTNLELELQSARAELERLIHVGGNGLGTRAVTERRTEEVYGSDWWAGWRPGTESQVERVGFDTWLAESAPPSAADEADQSTRHPTYASARDRTVPLTTYDVREDALGEMRRFGPPRRPIVERWSAPSWRSAQRDVGRGYASPRSSSTRSATPSTERWTVTSRMARIVPHQIRSQPVPTGRVTFD